MNVSLANVEEFYLPAVRGLPPPSRAGWRRASELVAGTAFFWGVGERRLVLPAPVDLALAEELDHLLDAGGGGVLFPDTPVESLSRWLGERLQAGEPQPGFCLDDGCCEVLAWGQTEGLSALVSAMTALCGEVVCECGDESTLGLVVQIDSKTGLRHLLSTRSEVSASWMPEGFIAENLSQAAQLAEECLGLWGGCLVKADRSAAGWGIVAFDGAHPPRFPISRHLAHAARGMPELRRFPLVVERMVRREGRVVSISAQGSADGRGGSIFHFCALHLDGSGAARVGKGILGREVEAGLRSRFTALADLLSSLGYRGILGVDFALDGEGEPAILEVNPRRTTLTAAYDGARRLELAGGDDDFCVLYLPKVEGAAPWGKLPPAARRLLCQKGGVVHGSGWLPVAAPGFSAGAPEWRGALLFARDAGTADELAWELTDTLRPRR